MLSQHIALMCDRLGKADLDRLVMLKKKEAAAAAAPPR